MSASAILLQLLQRNLRSPQLVVGPIKLATAGGDTPGQSARSFGITPTPRGIGFVLGMYQGREEVVIANGRIQDASQLALHSGPPLLLLGPPA